MSSPQHSEPPVPEGAKADRVHIHRDGPEGPYLCTDSHKPRLVPSVGTIIALGLLIGGIVQFGGSRGILAFDIACFVCYVVGSVLLSRKS